MNRKVLYLVASMIVLLAPLLASGEANACEIDADDDLSNGVSNAYGHLSLQGLGNRYGHRHGQFAGNDLEPTDAEAIVKGFYWGD